MTCPVCAGGDRLWGGLTRRGCPRPLFCPSTGVPRQGSPQRGVCQGLEGSLPGCLPRCGYLALRVRKAAPEMSWTCGKGLVAPRSPWLPRSCGLCVRTLGLQLSPDRGEGDRPSGFPKHLGLSGRGEAPAVSPDLGEGDRVPGLLGLLRCPRLPGCLVLWGWRPAPGVSQACQEGGRLQGCPQLAGCPWPPGHLGLPGRSWLREVLQARGGRGRQCQDLQMPGLPQGWGCPALPGCLCP